MSKSITAAQVTEVLNTYVSFDSVKFKVCKTGQYIILKDSNLKASSYNEWTSFGSYISKQIFDKFGVVFKINGVTTRHVSLVTDKVKFEEID